ncbi:MAG: phosphatidate cytidylyltransferase [Prevotellaceae bacterium]|jgi:phosphatidate cytidylyltransferase|nr:phosphatidate cytidylyltransferase [Prevotellaceae bacterium]
MKTLITRTLSGAVYVALIISAILINDYLFAAVFVVLSALTTFEFHKLTNKQENVDVNAWLAMIGSIAVYGIFCIALFSDYKEHRQEVDTIFFISCILLLMFYFYTFIEEIFAKKSNPIHSVAYAFFGLIYAALPFGAMLLIRSENKYFLLALFVIIWANDTFAYLVGSRLGKHRLCERISPKKSWEGFFGGLIGALIAGFVFSKFCTEINLWQWLVFALIIVVFGTLGDLFESLIKRTVGVKDSGNIMPGHGGFLDRLDSVIFSAIPVFIFLLIFN